MENLSPNQVIVVNKLRDLARDFIKDEFILAEDDLLISYLIKYDFDLKETLAKLREGFELLYGLTAKAEKAEKMEVFHCRKYLPYGQCGKTKTGALVWYIRTGMIDINGIWKSAGSQGIFNFAFQEWQYIFEYVKEECLRNNRYRYKGVLIIDMQDCPVWVLGKYEYIKFVLEMKSRYYKFLPLAKVPCVDGIYLINNSLVYRPIIDFCKFIAPNDSIWNKVRIFGKDKRSWVPELLEIIEEDQLPKAYGGTLEDPDEYCTNRICPGGKVPKHFYRDPSSFKDIIDD